jgi:hypothetical protein
MNIEVLKTEEIPESLWSKIAESFNCAFEGHHTTGTALCDNYKANPFGYSYHGFSQDNGKIIAFNTITPSFYCCKGEKRLFGLSGSTFVLKEYRKNVFILADIYDALIEYCKKDNMVAFLGVPNKNSYKYLTTFLSFREVFTLSYYVLPVKLSNILKFKSPIWNVFSILYFKASLGVNSLLSALVNTKEKNTSYQIDIDDNYLDKRFHSSHYKKIQKGDKRAWYTIADEDGVRTAYIMDFRQGRNKTFHSLLFVVQSICRNEKIDIVMYVGTMNLRQILLVKVPSGIEPKRLPFTYYLLNKEDEDKYKDMDSSENWDFGLLNFDVR